MKKLSIYFAITLLTLLSISCQKSNLSEDSKVSKALTDEEAEKILLKSGFKKVLNNSPQKRKLETTVKAKILAKKDIQRLSTVMFYWDFLLNGDLESTTTDAEGFAWEIPAGTFLVSQYVTAKFPLLEASAIPSVFNYWFEAGSTVSQSSITGAYMDYNVPTITPGPPTSFTYMSSSMSTTSVSIYGVLEEFATYNDVDFVRTYNVYYTHAGSNFASITISVAP